jgi:hypothetical protein
VVQDRAVRTEARVTHYGCVISEGDDASAAELAAQLRGLGRAEGALWLGLAP